MNALTTSIIRTVTAILVGWLVTLAVRLGVEIDEATAATTVQAIVTGVVYAVVRFLEERVAPQFGWLLGLAKPPRYERSSHPTSTK